VQQVQPQGDGPEHKWGLQLGVWPDLSELLSGLLQVLRQVPMVVLLSMIPLVHHQILLPAEVKHFWEILL
ncbi:hypothetical protein ACNPFB_27135, partial [Klebsiella pneumoniae]